MLKALQVALCMFFFTHDTFGQERIGNQIDSLRYLGVDAFNCNSAIWQIIAKRKEAIPYLINLVGDSSLTSVNYHCKKDGKMKVGDVAFYALDEIVSVPMTYVTGRQFDLFHDGCQEWVYDYIEENRLVFQQQLQKWYQESKENFIWERYEEKYLTECQRKNYIFGYFHEPFGAKATKKILPMRKAKKRPF